MATDMRNDVSLRRCPGQSVQDVLQEENKSRPVPPVLLEEQSVYLGSEDLPRERYFSKHIHDLEVERMWRRVWQTACREEDIPEVGDSVVYDIAEDSIVIVRTAPDRIKGYYNACLHRGALLRTIDGNVPELKCPFHGWTWGLDGALKSIPSGWDFAHISREEFCLPEVLVDTWDGWVFINMDPQAPPLLEYLEPLPQHFSAWPMSKQVKIAHVASRVACNWKVLLELFIESYHAYRSHPQWLLWSSDANTQYDVFSDHVSRMITMLGVPSPHLPEPVAPEAVAAAYVRDLNLGDPTAVSIPANATTRDVLADRVRADMEAMCGVDLSGASNSEMIDGIEYLLFPNFMPWTGSSVNLLYRARPDGGNPESAIAEVMFLASVPDGVPRPGPAEIHWVDPDDWMSAPELGLLGPTNNQDFSTLPTIQRGLKTTRKSGVTLGNYQEMRIRHHAHTLEKYLKG